MADEELSLRRWTPEDQEQVLALHELGLKSTNAYAARGPWDDDLEDIEGNYLANGGEFLVGFLGNQLVAMGALSLHEGSVAEIRRMRVHPDFQRRGFGQKLLEVLEDLAVDRGCSVIRLDTTSRQEAAQALYLKNGYVEVQRDKSGPLEVILLEKRL